MKKLLTILAILLALSPLSAQAVNVTVPSSPGLGSILYGLASGNYTTLTVGANGDCLKLALGIPLWGSCGAGGGGTDANWSFFNTSGIRLATTSNQVLIGASSTTTRAALEVIPTTTAAGAIWATGSSTLQFLNFTNATGTSATTTNFFSTTASSTNLNALRAIFANSTTTQATTTALAISGVTSSLLKTNSTGGVVAAISGTDYQPAGTYVTAVSVASANGFAGSSSGGATPALTLSTTITGLLKGNGTAISAATAGTDYLATVNATTPLSGSGTAGSPLVIANAVADGSTKGAASFTAADFDASSGNISIDYTNGQAASASNKGFLTSADWTIFNNKVGSTSLNTFVNTFKDWSIVNGALSPTTTLGVGIYASSTISALTVTNGTTTNSTTTNSYDSGSTRIQSLSGILKGTTGVVGTASNGTDYTLISATTCGGTDKVSAISASGVVTCSADQSGGGGSGGGTWSTTTSQVSGQLINYPNNSATDIVTIGATATTSAEFYFDPNIPFAKIGSPLLVTGSTTLQNFTGLNATTTNATSTNINISGNFAQGTTTPGKLFSVYGAQTGGIARFTRNAGNNPAAGLYGTQDIEVTGQGTIPTSGYGVAQTFTANGNILGNVGALTDGGLTSGRLVFNSYSAGTPIEVMTIRSLVNSGVGYGTSTPVGAVNISGGGTFGSWTQPLLVLSDMDATSGNKHTYASTTKGVLEFGSINDALTTRTQRLLLGNATSTLIGNLTISGNSTTTNATTTQLAITGITGSTQCLQVNSNGTVSGTGSACGAGGGGSSFGQAWELFGSGTYLAPTTTKGMIVNASSTIGNGTDAGGLTTNGGATTTGTAKFLGTTRFLGPVSQTALGSDRIDIGVEVGTPRMVFEDAGSTIWLVDNDGGAFRWYIPGFEQMRLVTSSNNPSLQLRESGNTTAINIAASGSSFFNGGSVGINDATPDFKFETVGSAGGYFGVTNSADGDIFNINSSGNVGIATTTPFTKLSIGGSAYIGGDLTATGTASTTNLAITSITGSTQCLQVNSLGQVSGAGAACGSGSGGGANSKFATSSDNMFVYPNGGIDIGIGIGTTTPHKLSDLNVASTAPAFIFSDTNGGTNAKHFGTFWNDGKYIWATTSDAQSATSSAGLTYDPTGSAYFGLGTTSPFYKFSIGTGNGSSTGSILVAEHQPATSTSITVDWTQGNQQLIRLGNAATTITFSNYTDGATVKVITCNPPTGTAGTVTWGTQVLWTGGTAPTQTTTAQKCDVFSFLGTMGTSSLKVFGSASTNF